MIEQASTIPVNRASAPSAAHSTASAFASVLRLARPSSALPVVLGGCHEDVAIGVGFLLSPALAPLIVLPRSLGAYPGSEQPLLLLLAPRDGEDHPLALDAFEMRRRPARTALRRVRRVQGGGGGGESAEVEADQRERRVETEVSGVDVGQGAPVPRPP
ncbi:hypothetical protein B0H14DRAFT_3430239 [Mycena olivaceomarginata]|nr:hypothetical protein B0H14DRAFT_3430239 [Mycena olivaceomarginata]